MNAFNEGVAVAAALEVVADAGVRALFIEGDARVITSFLAGRVIDRIISGVAPPMLVAGFEGVGDSEL